MKVSKNDLNKCGIYCIRNIINQKVYIGKSKNIYVRICNHISALNTKSKNENRYLINSWHKYGENNFEYFVLEYFNEIDEKFVSERELFWQLTYKATDKTLGYNLRLDSSTKMIVHEDTKKLISESNMGIGNPNYGNRWTDEMKLNSSIKIKEQFKNGRVVNVEDCMKGVKALKEKYEKYPDSKKKMAKKVSQSLTIYNIYQYTKDNIFIKSWNSVSEIIEHNPNYKRHNIYAVCSGQKPTMYGYIWVKILKNDDIVQQ
jgi:group I intron endonuclease